jgi:hypothetical protein
MCDSSASCQNISIGFNNSNGGNYNYSVAIGNQVQFKANNHFHIGSSASPLGVVTSISPSYATAYWPVFINGSFYRIALV